MSQAASSGFWTLINTFIFALKHIPRQSTGKLGKDGLRVEKLVI